MGTGPRHRNVTHWLISTQVLYIGVVNDDVANAREDAKFTVAVRTAQVSQFPCLMQCNGHGTCDYSTGDCKCDRGWAGAVADRPDTCQFEIQRFERHSSVDEDLLGEYTEGGQMGDAGRFEAPVPDEVPKIEMRKVGDARVSPLHYGDDAAEGV